MLSSFSYWNLFSFFVCFLVQNANLLVFTFRDESCRAVVLPHDRRLWTVRQVGRQRRRWRQRVRLDSRDRQNRKPNGTRALSSDTLRSETRCSFHRIVWDLFQCCATLIIILWFNIYCLFMVFMVLLMLLLLEILLLLFRRFWKRLTEFIFRRCALLMPRSC